MGYTSDIHPEPVIAVDYNDIIINHNIKTVYTQDENLGLLMIYWQCMGEQNQKQL